MKAKRVRKKSFAGLRTYRNGALLSPLVKTKTGKKKRKKKRRRGRGKRRRGRGKRRRGRGKRRVCQGYCGYRP
jgi:hypothetical protein